MDDFWENMGRMMARKLAINGRKVNPWNPVDTVQIFIDAAHRKPPKVNTGTVTKTVQPQNMGTERVRGGYKETGGAQSQAYQGRVPGSTYDKTKPGTYTPYTETGGAQGQATTAPGTGKEGFDMLLGKGKYAGVYNKWNRPSDTILLAKILESVILPKSANVMYNGADSQNAGGAQGQAVISWPKVKGSVGGAIKNSPNYDTENNSGIDEKAAVDFADKANTALKTYDYLQGRDAVIGGITQIADIGILFAEIDGLYKEVDSKINNFVQATWDMGAELTLPPFLHQFKS